MRLVLRLYCIKRSLRNPHGACNMSVICALAASAFVIVAIALCGKRLMTGVGRMAHGELSNVFIRSEVMHGPQAHGIMCKLPRTMCVSRRRSKVRFQMDYMRNIAGTLAPYSTNTHSFDDRERVSIREAHSDDVSFRSVIKLHSHLASVCRCAYAQVCLQICVYALDHFPNRVRDD